MLLVASCASIYASISDCRQTSLLALEAVSGIVKVGLPFDDQDPSHAGKAKELLRSSGV